MATEILINDGGAPARILPFLNGSSAIEAGVYVDIHSDGTLKVTGMDQAAGTSAQKVGLGVLLSDVAAGAMGNVITGRGIICNVQTVAGLACGAELCVDDAGLLEGSDNTDANRCVGTALAATFSGTDSGGNATNFTKVLLI